MLSHYLGVGSTVVGAFQVNSIKGRAVTKAMLGRLSGNPNVLDHFSEATVSRQLMIFVQKDDL